MLNFDFFQPYKHTPESYGVFYMTLLNLPRNERFKQENVLLVAAFEHEPPLNPFMEPLVRELQEFGILELDSSQQNHRDLSFNSSLR